MGLFSLCFAPYFLLAKLNVGSRKTQGYISVSGTLLIIDVISSVKSDIGAVLLET